MLDKSFNDFEPHFSISDKQMAQLFAIPEERFGLSEVKRKEIWKKLVLIEDKALSEAEKRFPLNRVQSLKVGQKAKLAKKTPLMPEFEPADPMSAIQEMLYLPSSSVIVVKKIRKKNNTPWYYVEVETPFRDSPLLGWINSDALMGQFPVNYEEQLGKQREIEDELMNENKTELAKEYNIDQDLLYEISLEGLRKGWAFPKMEK